MKNFKYFFGSIFLSLIFVSCNKKGCSDPTADNYIENVRKAQDVKCQYNGEGICGEGITFCIEINKVKKIGDVTVSQPTSGTTRLFWANGSNQNSPGYEDLQIEFATGTKDNLQIGSAGNSKKFQAAYYSLATGFIDATAGSMLIKKNNSSDGIIATFSLTLNDSLEIKEGNIYKAK